MPRVNVTGEWLRDKIAEMQRLVRLYMDQTAYDEYFARVADTVHVGAEEIRDAANSLKNMFGVVADLEEDLDAKS